MTDEMGLVELVAKLRGRANIAPMSYYTDLSANAALDKEAAAAIERLVAERDEARISAIDNAEVASDWSERATAAEAHRDKLKEVLSNLLPLIYLENDQGIGWRISASDDDGHEWDGDALRRARQALGDT